MEKSLLEAKKRNFVDFITIFFEKIIDLFRIIYFGLKVVIKLIFIKLY
ncbi:MAG: hypothetical protein N2485_00590 [bacterium]|nr:hypothetical protein [bacterium]